MSAAKGGIVISYTSELVRVESVRKDKDCYRVKVCRTMERNKEATIVWKDLRFVEGGFTAYPKKWAGKEKNTKKVLSIIQAHTEALEGGALVYPVRAQPVNNPAPPTSEGA